MDLHQPVEQDDRTATCPCGEVLELPALPADKSIEEIGRHLPVEVQERAMLCGVIFAQESDPCPFNPRRHIGMLACSTCERVLALCPRFDGGFDAP